MGLAGVNHQKLILLYEKYNKRYGSIITGYDKVLRGIMHYNSFGDSLYRNTTLFGKRKSELSNAIISRKQQEIKSKIIKLNELSLEIKNNKIIEGNGIELFLLHQIEKTKVLLKLIKDSVIPIEAAKTGLHIEITTLVESQKKVKIIHQKMFGSLVFKQSDKVKNIAKHISFLLAKSSSKGFSLTNDLLPNWLKLKQKQYGLNNDKVKALANIHNVKMKEQSDIKINTKQTLMIMLLCVKALLLSRGFKDFSIHLHIDKAFESLLGTELTNYLLMNIKGLIITFDQDLPKSRNFTVKIGKKSWKLANDTLYVPGKLISSFSLKLLCEIIDHEIATHEVTSHANKKLLNTRSIGYRKLEEGMAVFNQNLVSVSSPKLLKLIPTYHHIASLFAEEFGFEETRKLLIEYFRLIGEPLAKAKIKAHQTALKTKRFNNLNLPGSNTYFTQYTNGYYSLLKLYNKTPSVGKDIEDEPFSELRKKFHLGRFTKKDLDYISPFLKLLAKDQEIHNPLYFGRLLYQHIVYNKPVNEIINADIRYKRLGILDSNSISILNDLCVNVGKEL